MLIQLYGPFIVWFCHAIALKYNDFVVKMLEMPMLLIYWELIIYYLQKQCT